MTDEAARKRWRLERPTMFVVGAVAIIIALLAISALAQLQATDTSSRVARSLATSDTAERLLGILRDAETGQRGYLLTGQQAYLDPYVSAKATVDETYDKLLELVSGNREQQSRVTALKQSIAGRMAAIGETVALTQSGDRDSALKVIIAGTGKTYMDEIRSGIEEIEAVEATARQQLGDTEGVRRIVNLAAFLVAVLGLIVLGWWLLRTGQRLAAELEIRVEERTSALRREQSRVELLLHDMNHRVGNNLAVIAAILGMQRRQSSDPEVQDALAVAEERIAAIGATQRRLRLNLDSDDIDGKQFFLDLCEDLRQSCAGRPITIAADVDEVRLPGREAVTYGVLVNELMTNAIKHAFPDGMAGTIMLRVGMPDENAIEVEVVDDGRGMPNERDDGLGTKILTSLARSLGATVTVGPAAPGADRPGVKASFMAAPTRKAVSA